MSVNIDEMLRQKSHHVLGTDGKDIVIFGLSSSIRFLSETTLIQGDGTFSCVVQPFTQLYIFHGLLKNGVSYPLLYCLLRGKNQKIYERLLELVEGIAGARGATIFKRPVRVMVDFEKTFHNALKGYQAGNQMSCCFFHFVSNLKKRSKPIIEAIKKATGKESEEVKVAERTKRELMMIPLLPLDIISVDVVDFIIRRWKMRFDGRKSAFDDLRGYLIRTYFGANALFEKRTWCVCACVTRTNNAAESSHAKLNSYVRVSGAVPLDLFLFSIESQMRNTTKKIEGGCRPHSKAIYSRRNQLLAAELSELLNAREGVLSFLDHCSSILKLKKQNDVNAFLRNRMNQPEDPLDVWWVNSNRERLVEAAISLHGTLFPTRRTPPLKILTTVPNWAFQPEQFEADLEAIQEDSTFSFVRTEPPTSYLEIVNRFNQTEVSSDENETSIETRPASMNTDATQLRRVYEGQSYRIQIVQRL